MSTLIILGIVFLALVFILLVRIQSLVEVLSGQSRTNIPSSNSTHGFLLVIFYFALMGAFYWLSTHMSKALLPKASSVHGVEVDNLFWITTAVMSFVFIVVNFFLYYFAFVYRHKEGQKAYFYSHNDKIEIIWTIIPAIVLAVLVIYGWRLWSGIMAEAPKDAMVYEIVGKQFNWIARHPGADASLGNHNFRKIDAINQVGIDFKDKASFDDIMVSEMHVVVNKPVKFNIRARDVMHNFYLPHFRIKMDAVPGVTNTIWFTPTKTTAEMRTESGNTEFNYEIVCNQICGRGHFGMRGIIVVDSEEDYKKWLATQEPFLKKNPDLLTEVPDDLKPLAKLQLKEKVALNN